jgi:hypothetical protein
LEINPAFLIGFVKSVDDAALIGDLFVTVVEEHMIMNRNAEEYTEEQIMYFAGLILHMLDAFGDTLLKNGAQILKFLKTTLLDQDPENLHMGLTLLTQLLGPQGLE